MRSDHPDLSSFAPEVSLSIPKTLSLFLFSCPFNQQLAQTAAVVSMVAAADGQVGSSSMPALLGSKLGAGVGEGR